MIGRGGGNMRKNHTLDNGAPVSVYTVARELGHGGESLVKRVYGHPGETRHRSEGMEYNARKVL
jgi:hypothetical protein